MTYKTILVHVDDSQHAAARISIAAQLARDFDAHLIGAAVTGISRFAFQAGAALPPDPSISLHMEHLRQRARQALEQAEIQVRREGVSSFEKHIVDDDASGGLAELARYSDVVVISQFDPDRPNVTVRPDFPEYVVFNSGRPTLILPHSAPVTSVAKRILIAWDGSRQATRAVIDALPLMRQASLVQVVIFNEEETGAEELPGGTELAQYLARHGVNIELLPGAASSDVGNSLLSMATDLSIDLIVMGGYGHSRFREILLGGATRTILESMTIPVLMSH